MFGKLLFFFVFPKLGISYKVKNPIVWAVSSCISFNILITSEFVIYLLSLYLYDMSFIISFTDPNTFICFHIYSKYLLLSVLKKGKRDCSSHLPFLYLL